MKTIQIITVLLATIIITGIAKGQSGYGNTGYQYPQPSNGSGQGGKVEVYDQGLQMPTGSYTVPNGWQIVQDYATNPNTGQPMKQKLDIVGPQGELLRSLGMAQYADMMGTNFEQSWKQMTMSGLKGELNQVNLGRPTNSARMQRNQMMQQYAQTAASQGFKLELLEASVSGNRNGQPYQGLVSIVHLFPANMPNMGTIQVSFTICPTNRLEPTLNIGEQIANSFQPNPQYQQRLQQIQQKMMGGYGNNNPYHGNGGQSGYPAQGNPPVQNQYPSQSNQPYEQYEPITPYDPSRPDQRVNYPNDGLDYAPAPNQEQEAWQPQSASPNYQY
ncbi:MAG: hypothetical protein AAF944_00200 [Bacteroidota bacterium]